MAVGVNIVSTFDSKGIKKAVDDFKKLNGAGNKATFGLRTFDKGVTNTLQNVAKLGAGVAIAAGAIGYKLASAAYDAQKVMAQTEAIIKATGGAANITASQVEALSSKLSMQIGVDDELIQSSANLLLTFKQVQNQIGANNQIFDRAVIAAQDLGNVFGSSSAAAIQLGKALSDPEKGITALRRAGINFTDAQKEQIKTLVQSGDVLSAQKLILAEVESQVGGTAAATATGFDRMKVALENVSEEFGAVLIPYIEKFADYVIENVVPYLTTLAQVIGDEGVGAALKLLAGDFLKATTNMGAFGNVVLGLTAAFVALRLVAIAATISMNLLGVSLFANPVGLVVAAVIALGVALAALYLKFESVRTVINLIALVLKTAFMNVIEAIYNAFVILYNGFAGAINILIKAANLFGANIPNIEMLGYKAFTVIGNAAEDAGKKIGASRKSIDAYGSRLDALAASFGGGGGSGGGGGGVGGAVETFKEKIKKYVDALKGLKTETKAVEQANKSLKNAQTSLTTANEKSAAALEKFNKVARGYGADSKEAIKQARVLADAQRNLGKANQTVTDATAKLFKAEQNLINLRTKPSAMVVEDAEIGVEQAKLDAEQATFDVLDAEKELADLRTKGDATPQEIRKAEISLQEAKWAQRDATINVTEAEAALKKLRENTPTAEEIAEAEREVADAKLAVEDAIIGQQDATQNLNEENLLYSEIVSGAAEDTDIYKEALKELTEAQKDSADAQVAVTDAYDQQRQAVERLIEAEIELQKVKSGVGGAVVIAGNKQVTDIANQVGTRLTAPSTPLSFTGTARDLMLERGGFRAFADGGVVTSPMLGLVGEAGSEAIIPLDQLGSFGGQTINVVINAGMGADATTIGDEIVNVLQRYNRRNGALPLKVA
jgi:hypothetical protein